MTSMFDQYEQASQTTKVVTQNVLAPLTSSGYITMQLEDDTPIFSKQKMNFNPSDSITHICVASDYLILAMANHKLFRIDLRNPDRPEEISLTKSMQNNLKIGGMFLDPLGNHLLLSIISKSPDSYPDLLYLHRKTSKLKSITKSRSYEITEVGWNHDNKSEASSNAILLGTSKGLIIETDVGLEGDKMFRSGVEQYWKQIFDVGKGMQTPITGIEFRATQDTNQYVVFVTTPKRLYKFVGKSNSEERPLLQQIFNAYLNVPESGFQEIPSSLNYSKFQFSYDKQSKYPSMFGWMTEKGIFHGKVKSSDNLTSSIIHGDLLSFPQLPNETYDSKQIQAPLAFILTLFHAVILYSDHVKAICLLNGKLVYEDYYSEPFGKLINIVKDPVKNTVWAITSNAVFRYKILREERNVWQIYAEKNEFELAKKYCYNNPASMDKINVKHAELLFNKGEYEKSAEIFADTQSSFETICLKFLREEKTNALMVFLQKKLDDPNNQDKIQITMLVVWIIELYLSQISEAKMMNDNSKEYKRLHKEFESFLSLPKIVECIKRNKSVIYDLMSSHGDGKNLIKLTILNGDLENVIRQHIYMKTYDEALQVLRTERRKELFYQFTPILLQEIPKATVKALIEQGKNLSPVKLLPALLSCQTDEKHVQEMIRYLEFSIQDMGCTEQAIHNYLLTLYAKHNHDALINYLASQGHSLSMVNYDIHYALRLCREKNLTEACVQLSSLLGLWESAVELALGVNVDLAKKIADMPEENDLRKKLWLKIAQYVIHGKEDIQQAMEFLQQCDLIKIEDVLGLFSDFVTIDHFREPICNSLQEYNQQIVDLREEMADATRSAEQVRNEIQTFRNGCTIIRVDELCVLCEITLVLRPFYLFPCGHKFHSDCLLSELQPLLGPAKKNKLQDLQRQLNSYNQPNEVNLRSSNKDEIRMEVDNILASECLYCGEHMIQAIDTPFISDAEWEKVMKEWE